MLCSAGALTSCECQVWVYRSSCSCCLSRLFCQLSIGGPATGLMFGIAMTAWLRFMYNNRMAEITLTVLTAYATYLVGDRLFGVSGVLAVVILGAMPGIQSSGL